MFKICELQNLIFFPKSIGFFLYEKFASDIIDSMDLDIKNNIRLIFYEDKVN